MNLKEAYSILELSPGVSADEAKKKYRELTRKFHPDRNKEPGAEDKFKKINEAYDVVKTGKSTDRADVHQQQYAHQTNFNPFIHMHQQRVHAQANHVEIHTTISFKDSVLGAKKDLTFTRNGKCADCDGQGGMALNNGCTFCGGKGQITGRRGNMIFSQVCNKCVGKVQHEECKNCGGDGFVSNEVSISVDIPGGITSANILRLGGLGNYMGGFMGMDQYTDAHLHINVTPEAGMSLEGRDVVSTLEISLLDALRGCSKSVPTVLGAKDIVIKPLSRNKDEVIIANMGVNRIGNQRVVLDVQYPKNTDKLIGTLIEETK
jgi:molecular chaperone DnaJ